MFLTLFRDSFGSTENESNALTPKDFLYNFSILIRNLFYQVGEDLYDFGKSSNFTLQFRRDFLTARLRREMLYSPRDYFPDGLDQSLAFRRFLDCRFAFGMILTRRRIVRIFFRLFCESLLHRKRFLDAKEKCLTKEKR